MLSDEEIAKIRRSADRYHEVPACFASDMLDEIARLRAENEKIRAARLRPETVEIVRRALDFYYGKSMELPPAFRGGDYDEVPVALADLNRCYPPEEE